MVHDSGATKLAKAVGKESGRQKGTVGLEPFPAKRVTIPSGCQDVRKRVANYQIDKVGLV